VPSIINVGGRQVALPDGARNIRVSNGRVWVNGVEYLPPEGPQQHPPERVVVKLIVEGEAASVQSDGDVEVAGGVAGGVTADGDVTCGRVGGNVTADGSVTVNGDVAGYVKADGSVSCGDVGGSVKADGDIIRR
jgi:cytoskeletal protein CcmA (bactofilin family)